MKLSKVMRWVLSTVVAMLGGGLAAIVPIVSDRSKYKFPEDFGSGKLWPYILMGWFLTFAGILLKSPVVKKAMDFSDQSEEQLEKAQHDLDKAKMVFQTDAAKGTEAIEKARANLASKEPPAK
jgi:hypothetical protein